MRREVGDLLRLALCARIGLLLWWLLRLRRLWRLLRLQNCKREQIMASLPRSATGVKKHAGKGLQRSVRVVLLEN
jgi:hypothetical protein